MYCKSSHSSKDCNRYATLAKRWARLVELSRCMLCGSSKHKAKSIVLTTTRPTDDDEFNDNFKDIDLIDDYRDINVFFNYVHSELQFSSLEQPISDMCKLDESQCIFCNICKIGPLCNQISTMEQKNGEKIEDYANRI